MKLVIVESPAKAKTINKYLGSDYKVLASFGHIRDLPSKDGSVNPEHNFDMTWELSPGGKKRLNDIIAALKDCDTVLLALHGIFWKNLQHAKKLPVKKLSALFFMKLLNQPLRRLSKIRVPLTIIWFQLTWRAARLIIWWALPYRRCCGASFRGQNPPEECSRLRCA